MFKQNRLGLILRTGWAFAGGYKLAILAYTVLFMLAQAVALLEPYVLGLMLNSVQTDITTGANSQLLHDVMYYMSLFFALKLGFWIIHGPTRLLERHVA